MILRLYNKEKEYTFEVIDLNDGSNLFYHFNIPTKEIEDGKYNLELIDNGTVVYEDIIVVGQFKNQTIQYNRGENIYISSPLIAQTEDVTVEITATETVVYPTDGYDAMTSVHIDATPVYENGYNTGNEIGYNTGKQEGEEIGYNSGYTVGNADGYETGYNVGVAEQKSKLESISITENGTYSREDGYNQITVEVPDLNGDYNTGYNEGFEKGKETGVNQAEEIIAENAIDLVATEFRTYYTKYSDNIVNPNPVTGIYPDGEKFYNLANIKNIIYDTGIIPNETTKLEFWFIPDDDWDSNGKAGLVYTNVDAQDGWGVHQNTAGNQTYYASLGTLNHLNFPLENFSLNHIVMSYTDGLIVNETKIGDFTDYGNINQTLLINGVLVQKYSPDGGYGMIKITQDEVTNVIIPTEDGLKNITTDEMLEVVYNEGTYEYINNDLDILDNLIKTVNVQPKIDVEKYGIKLGYSTFKEVPDFLDFSNVTDMSYMFNNSIIQTIPKINTSNVNNMAGMFSSCYNLTTIPLIDTSNVTKMNNMFQTCRDLTTIPLLNTSNVIDMSNMFSNCKNLTTIPQLDTSNVTKMDSMFYDSPNLVFIPPLNANKLILSNYNGLFYFSTMNNLTDFGGLIGLKSKSNNDYTFVRCPNLTYQSCINILNGLYDFTGNGETPTSDQGQLKVHQNFLTTVGDEISIATNKGWQILA